MSGTGTNRRGIERQPNMAKRWKQRAASAFYGILLGVIIPTLALGQATLLPDAKQQYSDDAGNPIAGGSVTYYVPTTGTKKNVWLDAAKTTPSTNPVILDAAGRPQPTGQTYGDGVYRQQVKDANNVVIWDAITTSTGGGGSTPSTPTVGDGNIVGTILPWAGLVAPPNYVFAYGQAILRANYPLFAATVTITANLICTSGLNVLSGIADTQNIRTGAPVEATCIPPGTTVTAVATNSVTISASAAVSTAVTATFFPYGNGNGSTTLNVPDLRGMTLVGRQNMGGMVRAPAPIPAPYWNLDGSVPNALGALGGSSNHPMVVANLPPYIPTGTITNGAITSIFTGLPGQTGLSGAGGSQAYASGAFASSQIIGTVISTQATSIFSGVAQGGTAIPFPTVQPSIAMNYVIKVLPDVSTAVATGVASLGGMTGVIACGAGVTCGSNTISTAGTNVPAASVTFQQTGTGSIITNFDALLRTKYYTPQMFGALCDGNADDSAALQATINAIPATGGTIYTPAGSVCNYATTLVIPAAVRNITLLGTTNKTEVFPNPGPSQWVYTGTGARGIDARNTLGFYIQKMGLTYSSVSGFTGSLVDLAAAYWKLEDSRLATTTNRVGTATLLNLSSSVDGTIDKTFFEHGFPSIKGGTVLGQNTVTTIKNSTFAYNDAIPINECGESWTITGTSFEPLTNGQAGAFTNTAGLPCLSMTLSGNWFGDISLAGGTWIAGYFDGFKFDSNRMDGDLGSASMGVNILGGNGIEFGGGNSFEFLSTAMNFAAATTKCVVSGGSFVGTGVTAVVGNPTNCTNGASLSTSTGTLGVNLGSGAPISGLLPNSNLLNPATTVNGQTCTLGAACTVTASSASIAVGTTTIIGGATTRVLYDNAGVLGEYTAAQLTAQMNLATTALSGALPAWPNNTTTFFRGDGTYAAVAASGLTGTLQAAQEPAHTGDVTNSAGSLAMILTTAQPAVHTWALAQTFTVAPVFTDASGTRTALGLGTMATQNASAVAITGGTAAGLTGLAIRDTSAAFDVTVAATSSGALSAGRTLTLNMGNVAHTLAFGTTANTITFPNLASFTVITNGDTGTVTNAMLANSTIPINGTTCTLGSACTITAAAGMLTGATLAAGVTGSSLTSLGTITSLTALAGTFTTLAGTTSTTSPLVIGGTGTTGTQLTLKSTTASGTTDAIALVGGNNGATPFGIFNATGLGIGAATTPIQPITINFSSTSLNGFLAQNTNSGGVISVQIMNDGSVLGEFGVRGSARATYGALVANDTYFYANSSTGMTFMADNATSVIKWTAGGNVLKMQLSAAGGLSVGSTTDPGAGGMQINGQTFVPNAAADTATTDNTACIATTGGKLLKGTGTLGICLGTSGRQFKTAFASMTAGIDEIAQLNLWNYRYREGYGDNGARMQYGPTAQDVEQVLPDLVRHDENGTAINYDIGAFVPISLHALQQLHSRIQKLEQHK